MYARHGQLMNPLIDDKVLLSTIQLRLKLQMKSKPLLKSVEKLFANNWLGQRTCLLLLKEKSSVIAHAN